MFGWCNDGKHARYDDQGHRVKGTCIGSYLREFTFMQPKGSITEPEVVVCDCGCHRAVA